MKPSLAISYALKKRSKKMADGGKIDKDMDHDQKRGPEGYPVYQEQAQNQKGVHTPVSGVTGFPGGKGTSRAGDLAKERYAGKKLPELVDESKKMHREKLHEMQSMKKPNLLAEGGQVQNPKDDVPEPNKKSAEDFQKGLQTPGTDIGKMVNNIKEGLGMADGGFIDEEMASGDVDHMGNDVKDNDDAMMEDDLVSRIMQSRANQYSRGGMVANESGIGKLSQMADSKPNQFDDLALRDELESAYTGANSGDELGDAQEDHDRNDIVARIMASRRKKDRMPRPA